ncbi:Lignostilbene-alpha,beta-dioxygenase isozyme I [Lachnellula cervina]|uniref:Lignostilbene-alpha,beta-dioxygenase isozyme I n=1 Tax=Lachnellula cervina TaxID=1316786 RepID=A0A7D8Z2U2_9HELO|nr:Lignostilbene-alpha,beta-dioxygenase isozyme I [Lachnellula cervina]
MALPPVSKAFPDTPQTSGLMAPCRFEGEVRNLEIVGSIPKGIDGTFYRVMPDPQFPAFIGDDPWFNGDGNVAAFCITDGEAHFKQKFVRTEKFTREREAHRALLGKYRNRFTDAVSFKVRSTANTNIVYFRDKLLACKEDSPPYAMNPMTLETLGLYDFDGQLPSCTFTAHPKLDPVTKEFVCFGYEARGDGTPDVCYFSFNLEGKLVENVSMVAPICAMIHDFAVTENWVIFPIIPQTCELERMKAGGEHWQWDPELPFYLGVLPRRGAKGSDVKWFTAPNSFPGHGANAYENEKGEVVFDLAISNKNVFFWWPDKDGNAPNPQEIVNKLTRFTFDPKADKLDLPTPEVLLEDDMEFSKIDDRFLMRKHDHIFFDVMRHQYTDFPAVGPKMGGGAPIYNSLGHLTVSTGSYEIYNPGSTHLVQEPIFIPRSAEEGDGWLMALVNNLEVGYSELHLVDTKNFSKAQAIIKLPVRLRPGLHGNWVGSDELAGSI